MFPIGFAQTGIGLTHGSFSAVAALFVSKRMTGMTARRGCGSASASLLVSISLNGRRRGNALAQGVAVFRGRSHDLWVSRKVGVGLKSGGGIEREFLRQGWLQPVLLRGNFDGVNKGQNNFLSVRNFHQSVGHL